MKVVSGRSGDEMIGIDIGGTFTDVVLLHDKRIARAKVLSSPGNYSDAVQTAVESLCEEIGLPPSAAIGRLVHATTVVTNTLLEGSGARTAFVTTRGFRDILGLARNRRPSLYDLRWRKLGLSCPGRSALRSTNGWDRPVRLLHR